MYVADHKGRVRRRAEVTALATALVDGLTPGRRSADQITLCDRTGAGVQDTAVAIHAVRVAAV